jgi:hypothetical protein
MMIEGMDVEAASLLLGFIRSQEQQFEDIIAGITSQLDGLSWTGTDEATFHRNWITWSGQIRSTAHQLIQDTSRALHTEIAKQQAASSN